MIMHGQHAVMIWMIHLTDVASFVDASCRAILSMSYTSQPIVCLMHGTASDMNSVIGTLLRMLLT